MNKGLTSLLSSKLSLPVVAVASSGIGAAGTPIDLTRFTSHNVLEPSLPQHIISTLYKVTM